VYLINETYTMKFSEKRVRAYNAFTTWAISWTLFHSPFVVSGTSGSTRPVTRIVYDSLTFL